MAKHLPLSYYCSVTRHDLQELVALGETAKVEFKQKLPEWNKLLREVVAFANTDGGTVLIGVDDDGQISGLKDPREIEEAIEIHLNQWVRPAVDYRLAVVPLTQKRAVVAIVVSRSQSKPHYVRDNPEANEGVVLIRIADNSVKASKEKIQLLKYEGREQNMKVEYGEKERILMRYLETNKSITVTKFADLAMIPRNIASRTLVHLVKANVLRHRPGLEQPDQFFPVAE